MKKLLMSAMAILLSLNIYAQNEFSIKGHVSGTNEETVISLYRMGDGDDIMIATDTIKNDGLFNFKEKVSNGKFDKLYIKTSEDGLSDMTLRIYAVPNATITVTGNDNCLGTWKIESNVTEQADINKFIECARAELNEFQKLSIQKNQLNKNNEPDDEVIAQMNKAKINALTKQLDLLKTMKVSKTWIDMFYDISLEAKKMGDKFPFVIEKRLLYNRLNMQDRLTPICKKINDNLFHAY